MLYKKSQCVIQFSAALLYFVNFFSLSPCNLFLQWKSQLHGQAFRIKVQFLLLCNVVETELNRSLMNCIMWDFCFVLYNREWYYLFFKVNIIICHLGLLILANVGFFHFLFFEFFFFPSIFLYFTLSVTQAVYETQMVWNQGE